MTEPEVAGGSLEAELDRLAEIVAALEGDALDLDGALALFEEGVARLRAARTRLGAAELRLKELREAADGDAATTALDA